MYKKILMKVLPIAIRIGLSREKVLKSGMVIVKNGDHEEKRKIIGYETYRLKSISGRDTIMKVPIPELKENEVEIGRSFDDSIIYIGTK